MRGVVVLISLLLIFPLSTLSLPVKGVDIDGMIGQMIMLWFEGSHITEDVERIIGDYGIGGVILFSWAGNLENKRQISELTSELQTASLRETGMPLFISIDQEGGKVVRLPGATDFPGNMALGATGDDRYAEIVGEMIGIEMGALGINMNFAPVLDVNSNQDNPVIGLRSFGEDPDLVSVETFYYFLVLLNKKDFSY